MITNLHVSSLVSMAICVYFYYTMYYIVLLRLTFSLSLKSEPFGDKSLLFTFITTGPTHLVLTFSQLLSEQNIILWFMGLKINYIHMKYMYISSFCSSKSTTFWRKLITWESLSWKQI